MDNHGDDREDERDWPAVLPILLRSVMPRLFTIEHAAVQLDVSERTVRRLLDDGELRRVRLSAQGVRIRSDDLAAFITRRTEENALADLPEPGRRRGELGIA